MTAHDIGLGDIVVFYQMDCQLIIRKWTDDAPALAPRYEAIQGGTPGVVGFRLLED